MLSMLSMIPPMISRAMCTISDTIDGTKRIQDSHNNNKIAILVTDTIVALTETYQQGHQKVRHLLISDVMFLYSLHSLNSFRHASRQPNAELYVTYNFFLAVFSSKCLFLVGL